MTTIRTNRILCTWQIQDWSSKPTNQAVLSCRFVILSDRCDFVCRNVLLWPIWCCVKTAIRLEWHLRQTSDNTRNEHRHIVQSVCHLNRWRDTWVARINSIGPFDTVLGVRLLSLSVRIDKLCYRVRDVVESIKSRKHMFYCNPKWIWFRHIKFRRMPTNRRLLSDTVNTSMVWSKNRIKYGRNSIATEACSVYLTPP